MFKRELKVTDLLDAIVFLTKNGVDGDIVVDTDIEGEILAKRVSEDVILIASDISVSKLVTIYRTTMTRDDIELGDLLYLQCGAILRVITKQANDKLDYQFDLEIIVNTGLSDGYKPFLPSWNKNLSYGVNDYLDIVEVHKLNGDIQKTSMWDKHNKVKNVE